MASLLSGIGNIIRSDKAAAPQWQEWQGRGAAVGEVMEVKEVREVIEAGIKTK